MSVATLQSLLSDAKSSIASSDWGTAKNKLMQAKAELAGIPDAGDGSQSYRFRTANEIDDLYKMVNQQHNATVTSGGIGRMGVTYKNPST